MQASLRVVGDDGVSGDPAGKLSVIAQHQNEPNGPIQVIYGPGSSSQRFEFSVAKAAEKVLGRAPDELKIEVSSKKTAGHVVNLKWAEVKPELNLLRVGDHEVENPELLYGGYEYGVDVVLTRDGGLLRLGSDASGAVDLVKYPLLKAALEQASAKFDATATEAKRANLGALSRKLGSSKQAA